MRPITHLPTDATILNRLKVPELKKKLKALDPFTGINVNKSLLVSRILACQSGDEPKEVDSIPLSSEDLQVIKLGTKESKSISEVLTEADKITAVDNLKSLTQIRLMIRSRFESNIEQWSKTVRTAQAGKKGASNLLNSFLAPVDDCIEFVKNRIAEFEFINLKKAREEVDRVRSLIDKDKQARRDKEIEELYIAEKDSEAAKLEEEVENPSEGSLFERVEEMTLAADKTEGLSTKLKYTWELVDKGKLNRCVLKTDTVAINALVKMYGLKAGEFVGDGSIKISEVVDVRVYSRGESV